MKQSSKNSKLLNLWSQLSPRQNQIKVAVMYLAISLVQNEHNKVLYAA